MDHKQHPTLGQELSNLLWLVLVLIGTILVLWYCFGRDADSITKCCLDPARTCTQCSTECCPDARDCCCRHQDKCTCEDPTR